MAKKLDKVDVVIVGSGWAGGITAAELSKKGYKVVILERGVDQKTEDFIGSKDELRYSRRSEMMQDVTKETITVRNNIDGKAVPLRDKNDAGNGTNTGGSSVHWNGHNFRFLPYDFEIYSKTVERYGKNKIPKGMTIQDWGITYDELEPYYDKYEKTAGISGEENPIGPHRSDEFPNPAMKDTPALKLFKKATKDMGYHPYQVPSANLTEQYENPDGEKMNACVYCAFCEGYGCDFGAKSNPMMTVLPTARKTDNFELRNNAYATRVIHDDKKAKSILYVDTETNEEFEQPADIVVLAGYIYTNNKLLLVSEIGDPYNPKTKTGIIGKNFTAHLGTAYVGARGFFKEKKFNTFAGAGALASCIDDFSGDNMDHGDLDYLHGFMPQIRVMGDRPIDNNHVPKETPLWGKEFKKESLYYTNRSLLIDNLPGVLPHEENYLDLDPNYKDVFGDPLLRVTYDYTDQDIKLGQDAIKKTAEIMEEMGADIVEPHDIPDDLTMGTTLSSSHVHGGVIMGGSSNNSAVNNYSQMWNMDNLFVVGGSSFPHLSNYNPTETIGALAYRAAEGMIEYLEGDGGLLIESKEKSEV